MRPEKTVKKAVDLKEIWKPVVEYENWYSVSNLGRIKRERKSSGTHKGLVLKPYLDKHGYLYVMLSRFGIKKRRKIHKLVTESFMGKCPENLQVNHKDCNKVNNNINNLEYITGKENLIHAHNNGIKFGNKVRKLTKKQVLKIRKEYIPRRVTFKMLAKKFKVHKSTIHEIISNQIWKQNNCVAYTTALDSR